MIKAADTVEMQIPPQITDHGKSKTQECYMLKKLIPALALAGLVSGQAMALTNAGFESGVDGWSPAIGGVVEQRSAGTVMVFDDNYGDFEASPVDPVSGSSYGMLVGTYQVSDPSTMYAFNLTGSPSVAGDKFYVRLFSAEYDLANNNDNFTVTFNTNTGAPTVFSWSVSDTYQYIYGGADPLVGINADSGWLDTDMPTGTNSVYFQINNVGDANNMPLVAVDFAPAAPVPETDVSLMMLAGLGVLGVVARRRTKTA